MDIKQLIPRSASFFDAASIKEIKSSYPLRPFDKCIVGFISELSKALLGNNEFNKVPALTALGFWLRKTNIDRIYKENFTSFDNKTISVSPAGLVFHICPSNVDTIFIYSLAISLLAGNKNIVRLSDRANHPYIQFLLDTIGVLLEKSENKILREYIYVISYGHEDEINAYFSEIADIRIIWGGDSTIGHFRNFKTNYRTKDIVFADRISYAIFSSAEILKLTDNNLKELVRKFYNDSYTFDQLGCSSPQMIFFLGNGDDNVKTEQIIYKALLDFSLKNYEADMFSITSLKFNKLVDDILSERVSSHRSDDHHLFFAAVNEGQFIEHSCGAGYFYTKHINKISEVLPYISKKVQTMSYFGISEQMILELANNTVGSGCDRLVPIGNALDFDYIWDGYNLIEELTVKKKIL